MLGIRPWEWSLLTVEDADIVCDALDQYVKDIQELERKARG